MRESGVILTALLIGFSFFPFWNEAVGQNIISVDQTAAGLNDGTSWIDAFVSLQDALTVAQSGDEVWVAAGVYKPDEGAGITPEDREASFNIPGGVSVYGGFAGTELTSEERDWEVNRTILSGDLLENDDEDLSLTNPLRQDNSFNVVRLRGVVDRVVLDGFSITSGMANGSGAQGRGAGIEIFSNYDNPDPVRLVVISNCLIEYNVSRIGSIYVNVLPRTEEPATIFERSRVRNNWGMTTAGIFVGAGKTIIRDVDFTENKANEASAIYFGDDNILLIGSTISNSIGSMQVWFNGQDAVDKTLFMWNTLIAGNTSERGTVVVEDGNFTSINNIISGNSTDHDGSAIVTYGGENRIINNVFAFNSAVNFGSVILTWDTNTIISNSIFWQNTAPNNWELYSWEPSQDLVSIGHSLVQQQLPDYIVNTGGIKTGDPLFLDADGLDNIPGTIDDDFRLSGFSSAVDSGATNALHLDIFDLDGDGIFDDPWPIDFASNQRVFNGGSGHTSVDMGAYEFDAPPLSTFLVHHPESVYLSTGSLEIYPNPAVNSVNMTWNLPDMAQTQVDLFDVAGRRIRTVFQGQIQTLERVTLNLTGLSPGVYFIKESTMGVVSQVVILK